MFEKGIWACFLPWSSVKIEKFRTQTRSDPKENASSLPESCTLETRHGSLGWLAFGGGFPSP